MLNFKVYTIILFKNSYLKVMFVYIIRILRVKYVLCTYVVACLITLDCLPFTRILARFCIVDINT